MSNFNLNQQTYIVPNSSRPGQTAIYRNAKNPELIESFSPDVRSLIDFFHKGWLKSRHEPCMGTRSIESDGRRGDFIWQTYDQISQRLKNFGSGLVHLDSTIQKPVGIWSVNRAEWGIADLAIAAYSYYTVALYDTLGPDTVEFVINHAELETVICSGNHITELLKLSSKVPKLKTIISMDALKPSEPLSDALFAWAADKGIRLFDFGSVEAIGQEKAVPYRYPSPNDMACIMYTSGTTGMPKGAILTHRNFVAAIYSCQDNVDGSAKDSCLSYLPLAHIFGRVVDTMILSLGGRIGYFSGNMETMMEDIQVMKPTVFPSVPRLLNKVYGKLVSATTEAPGILGSVSRQAVQTKIARLEAGKGSSHILWDRLLFNKIKNVLGGNVRIIVTGSAPIAQNVMQLLRVAFGCEVREAYGATETCATSIINYEGEYLSGNVGGPFVCNEIKLVDVPEMNYLSTDPQPRGEICARGPNIFKGYFKDDQKTSECIDDEGWFHTGDIGTVDERGAFVIIDRKKNIFKLSQGEYIAPEKIENIYVKDPVISQIYLYGDPLQSSLVAVVIPDLDTLQSIVLTKFPNMKNMSLQELCRSPEIVSLVFSRMNAIGKESRLRGFEFVKAIYLEPTPFSAENDLLTPTFKIKRNNAKKHYEAQIKAMYNELNNKSERARL